MKTYKVKSDKEDGSYYDVRYNKQTGEKSCTCLGYRYRANCKHLNEIIKSQKQKPVYTYGEINPQYVYWGTMGCHGIYKNESISALFINEKDAKEFLKRKRKRNGIN